MHQMKINYYNHSDPLQTVPNDQLNKFIATSIQNICSENTITTAQSVLAPTNSIATIPSDTNQARSSITNRTYLQCYSREANKNLVNWADQMSVALRDSVAHLDQICMRVRSCLSDLEANEIRYLHMQRRSSPMQQYQSSVASSLLQPAELYAVASNCQHLSDHDQDQTAPAEMALFDQIVESKIDDPIEVSEPLIEIESLPADTPIIVEPVAIQEARKSPRKDRSKRPKSRRGGDSSPRGSVTTCSRASSRPASSRYSSSRPSSPRPSSPTDKSNKQKSAVCRKIASVKSLKPIISVREHLELTKNTSSARQVYKKIFRNKQNPAQVTRLPTTPQISRPKSILKVQKFSTKTADITVKSDTTSTLKNTVKNKDNHKFNDSLWFKDMNASHAKLHDQCGCKVIVECPRVPTLTTPRASYNAQSRLQWIRAKNSLVLEYGKQHAANNATDTSGTLRQPVDILDSINDELVQPLKSEYPRKDSEISTLRTKNSLHTPEPVGFGGEDNDQLLRELLQDPNRLKGLVRTTSRHAFVYPNIFTYPAHLHNPCPTPIKQNSYHTMAPCSAYTQQQIPPTNSARLQRMHAQHKRKLQNKRKQQPQHQQKQEELVQKQLQQENKAPLLAGTGGDGGDLMMGKSHGTVARKDGEKSKDVGRKGSAGRTSRIGSGHNRHEDKENAMPTVGQKKESETNLKNWSTMSPNEIKTKLMPFLIPNERIYTVLPVTEITYDRKPPVTCLPPTVVTKGKSTAHLNSSQQCVPNKVGRGKPRSLYTDVQTQRKLDSYLELRDHTAYPKPIKPTIITTFPAITLATPNLLNSNTCSNRHSPRHHHQRSTHPRRQSNQLTPNRKYDSHRGTANPHHRRNFTASGSTAITTPSTTNVSYDASNNSNGPPQNKISAAAGKEQLQMGGGGMGVGRVGWLDKTKRAKAAISAATRRDIGSSIKQLEDKIAELISDPSKIGNGSAFDDVEQDIVRMLDKLNTSQEQSATTTTDDLIENRASSTDGSQAKLKSTVSLVTMESAITLTDSAQIAHLREVMKSSTEDTEKNEASPLPQPHHMGDIPELKKVSEVPCDAMEITNIMGLNKVGNFLSLDQNDNNKEQIKHYKSPRKEPSMQPIYEHIEPNSNINKLSSIDKEIFQIGTPRIAFKIENIPEYASVDILNLISDLPYSTDIKKLQRDDSPDSKKSSDEETKTYLKKLKLGLSDGTSCKPEQGLIVSTDNLCSIESDQFVTPFMKVVRKYRQEETHDNFMQFLEALTELSEDNSIVSTDTNNTKLDIKEISAENNPFYNNKDIQQLNPFYNNMKVPNDSRFYDCLKSISEKPTLAPLEFAQKLMRKDKLTPIEIVRVNNNGAIKKADYCNRACTVLQKTNNICFQLIQFILQCCKGYVDKRTVLIYSNYNERKTSVSKGLVLRFVYTILFAVVFMALK